MRVAVEEAIVTANTLRSIGVSVCKQIRILCDNKGVVDNSTIPGSALKKKHTSIAYHKTREVIASGLAVIYHMDGTENPADVLTKPLDKMSFLKHVGRLISGQSLRMS